MLRHFDMQSNLRIISVNETNNSVRCVFVVDMFLNVHDIGGVNVLQYVIAMSHFTSQMISYPCWR